MDAFLTSTEAARLLGVTSSTIKRWVNAGRIPCIVTPGGHRRILRAELDRFLHGSHPAQDDEVRALLSAMLRHLDTCRLQSLLVELRGRHRTWAAVADIAAGSLRELGLQWQRGSCSIAEEHAATYVMQQALFACSASLPSPPDEPTCVLAAVEGDQHTLGLSLAELCLREAGWSATWLGSPTPTLALLNTIELTRPGMVAVSASDVFSDTEVLARHSEAIQKACSAVGAVLVLAGGGRWPDTQRNASRIRSFRDFRTLLGELSVSGNDHADPN
jgi:excisionase family DNA binding protein